MQNSKIDFNGIWIPNITPFQQTDVYQINYPALGKLLDYLIDTQKPNGLVPFGTTGESNTLTTEEDREGLKFTLEHVAGRVPIMAGTGTNDTRTTIEATQFAESVGVDAALIVSPYYNRPDQRGIYAHFATIARNTSLPIFIYNIPARTGRNVEPETILKLAQNFPNIYGVKDVACDLAQTKKLIQAKKIINHPFYILTGEDCMFFQNLELGGDGAISASANVIGIEMQAIWQKYQADQTDEAKTLNQRIYNMFQLLFKEPNPAPIKACFDLMNFEFGGNLRLPLLQTTEELKSELEKELRKIGKI